MGLPEIQPTFLVKTHNRIPEIPQKSCPSLLSCFIAHRTIFVENKYILAIFTGSIK